MSFWPLRLGFSALPVIAGVDRFFDRLTDWTQYLWSGFPDLFDVTPTRFMYAVGIIEIVAGFVVSFAPRISSSWARTAIGALALFFPAMHHARSVIPVRRS